MRGVKPCPYCGGEVEVVKLISKTKEDIYRISCLQCRKTVAKGLKFDCETKEEGEERIQQYKDFMTEYWSPHHSTKIAQSHYAKERDYAAKFVGE